MGKNDYLNEFKYFNPWITHTGVITWVPEVRLHTKCLIKVIDFPFDTQCCELSFYSWAHSVKQMTIRQFDNKNKTNVTHLTKNTEWRVYNTYAGIRTIVTSEDYYWWVSTYSIFIMRDTSYHFYNLLMPCFGGEKFYFKSYPKITIETSGLTKKLFWRKIYNVFLIRQLYYENILLKDLYKANFIKFTTKLSFDFV